MPDSRYKSSTLRKTSTLNIYVLRKYLWLLECRNIEKTHFEQRLYLRENRKASKLVVVRLQMQIERNVNN